MVCCFASVPYRQSLHSPAMNKIGFAISSLFFMLVAGWTCLFVVDQRQFAVVYSLGEIKDVITEPGLHFKLPPPLQSVTFIDNRILTLDSPETRAIQTAEKKNLVVDWLIKWRVKDAKQFIRNNNGTSQAAAEGRLSPLVQAALNEEVTKRTVKDVLSTDREKIVQGVKARLQDDAQTYGIEIVDVRIKRVDFPASVADSVYSRMVSERKQEANRLRSTGAADGERIRADADKKREIVLATAYKEAQILKGQGDAKSAAIFNEAFGRDPQFASFYRSLEAYKTTFAKKSDVMVLDPSSDFFKAMKSSGKK